MQSFASVPRVSCLPWTSRDAKACCSADCKDSKAVVLLCLPFHWLVNRLAKPQVREWGNALLRRKLPSLESNILNMMSNEV